jgi:hypothetical protein
MFVDENAHVPCSEPFEALDGSGGGVFLATVYNFSPASSDPLRQWYVTGPKLNKDGSHHRGGHAGSRYLPPSEVPDYVIQAAVSHYQAVAQGMHDRFISLSQRVDATVSPLSS